MMDQHNTAASAPTALQATRARIAAAVAEGNAQECAGDFVAAEAAYQRAPFDGSPAAAFARVRRGVLCIARGEFERGWGLFELRDAGIPCRDWRGQPLAGATITVSPDYDGLGDLIQSARWLPGLKARGAGRVVYMAPQPLVRLFRSIPGIEVEERWTVMAAEALQLLDEAPTGENVRPFSLPYLFGAPWTIPAPPYLQAALADIELWRPRLPVAPLRVGLVWKGKAAVWTPNAWYRSLPGLVTLAPLWTVPGAAFVSLQKGAGEDEARAGLPGQPLTYCELRDFADTAAIIEQLDIVISVDTSTAHLAGAMGKPVWILSDWEMDWRWRDPEVVRQWYPTARLFRQHARSDWSGAVADIVTALHEFKRAREGAKEGL